MTRRESVATRTAAPWQGVDVPNESPSPSPRAQYPNPNPRSKKRAPVQRRRRQKGEEQRKPTRPAAAASTSAASETPATANRTPATETRDDGLMTMTSPRRSDAETPAHGLNPAREGSRRRHGARWRLRERRGSHAGVRCPPQRPPHCRLLPPFGRSGSGSRACVPSPCGPCARP